MEALEACYIDPGYGGGDEEESDHEEEELGTKAYKKHPLHSRMHQSPKKNSWRMCISTLKA